MIAYGSVSLIIQININQKVSGQPVTANEQSILHFGAIPQVDLNFFADMMPKEAFETIRETIEDVATHKRGGLLSIGFASAL